MYLMEQENKNCCGCMACFNICPVSAIKMETDKMGFSYPKADTNKCLDCGLCKKVCPMTENYVGQSAQPLIFAVKCRDKKILCQSSSGGMFTLLAKWIFENNGVVYGVAFDENFYVKHDRACTMAEAERFRSSKYIESDLTKVYEYICEDLQSDKKVLLTGTPCQISALTKFLELKHINTENLYTCDNICHGVPSRKIWKDYIDILKRKYIEQNDNILCINMRSKKESWKKQVLNISLKKGNIDKIVQNFSFNSFYLSLFGNRPSCFNCKYTSYKRSSDITTGDFWNVELSEITFDTNNGVNVVLINTEKGKRIFNQIAKNMDIQSVSKKAAWQPHLEYSAKAPKQQNKFWEEYLSEQDKEKLIKKYLSGNLLTRLIRFVTPILRKTGLYCFAGKLYKIMIVERRKFNG